MLGEFYREKILSHKGTILKSLENHSGEIRIQKDLFGWKLYSGKNFIECKSEEEARYLKVFLEAGLTEVRVPKDDEYLNNILPELEKLKIKIDKIINSYLETIMSRKVRNELLAKVWADILK